MSHHTRATRSSTPRRDLYQEITDQIIAALEAGVPPWSPAWSGIGGFGLPLNGLTRRPYQGINTVLLWLSAQRHGFTCPEWFTFDAAKRAAGFVKEKDDRGRTRWTWTGEGDPPRAGVRPGEKGTLITFWKTRLAPKSPEGEADEERRSIPIIRHFTVFNRAQIEGFPPVEMTRPIAEWERIERAERFLRESRATVVEDPSAGPHYQRIRDEIHLPPLGFYHDREGYYADWAHEAIHWTGHESRLARTFGKHRGDEVYALEELVAELGAAFTTAYLGIAGRERDHASYLAFWIERLRADKRLIFQVASAARAAAAYLGVSAGNEDEGDATYEEVEESSAVPVADSPAFPVPVVSGAAGTLELALF